MIFAFFPSSPYVIGSAYSCKVVGGFSLTSSSVAYFARLISDMCVWAEKNGFDAFDKNAVTKLVCDTAAGTAKLIADRQLNQDDLVRTVASHGDTTQRALDVFDARNLDGIVAEAMDACLNRANELSGNP